MNVLNELRLSYHRPTRSTQNRMACLKQEMQDKLIEYGQYINTYGQNMPEVRN